MPPYETTSILSSNIMTDGGIMALQALWTQAFTHASLNDSKSNRAVSTLSPLERSTLVTM